MALLVEAASRLRCHRACAVEFSHGDPNRHSRGNYIKEALWRPVTTDLMISNGPDGALTQKLNASMACSRTPLEGNELRYS